mgnify:CR=1 FL=1
MNELKTIQIDGTEYEVANFTDQQKALLAQVTDINQKLGNLQFQADQLSVAKDAFVQILKNSLTKPAE